MKHNGKRRNEESPYWLKEGQNGPLEDRREFWKFCNRVVNRVRGSKRHRSSRLTAHDIDELLVNQEYRCAVTGIKFDAPGGINGRPRPFGPSLDRIVPGGEYEIENVRLVCNIVNFAMNTWGEDVLFDLIDRMLFNPGVSEMSDVDVLKPELDRLTTWMLNNKDKAGTKEYRRAVLSHRLMHDLIGNGGVRREAVAERLREIEEGKHDSAA